VLNILISHVSNLLVEFEEVAIYHIKREHNSEAVYLAKLGSHLSEGTIIKKWVKGDHPHTLINIHNQYLMFVDNWRRVASSGKMVRLLAHMNGFGDMWVNQFQMYEDDFKCGSFSIMDSIDDLGDVVFCSLVFSSWFVADMGLGLTLLSLQ
jgi:hypothetical protein